MIATNQAFKDLKPIKNMYGEIKVKKDPIKPKYNPLKEHPEDIYIPEPKKETSPPPPPQSITDQINFIQNQINKISSSSLSSWRKEKEVTQLKKHLEKLKSLNKDNQKTY